MGWPSEIHFLYHEDFLLYRPTKGFLCQSRSNSLLRHFANKSSALVKALDPFQLLPASEDIHQRGVLKLVDDDVDGGDDGHHVDGDDDGHGNSDNCLVWEKFPQHSVFSLSRGHIVACELFLHGLQGLQVLTEN